MKKLKTVKLKTLIFVLVTLLSCNGFAEENKTPTITKTFDMNEPGTLNAKSSGGGVEVKTHDQQKVVIQAFVRKNGTILSPSDPSLNDVLKDFTLDFDKNGSVITANVERKNRTNLWKNAGISLVITVPVKMSCDVSSSGGGLKISGVSGTHNFTSSGGGIDLENTAGTTKARSSGGGVNAVNHNGDISLSSSGGGVTLSDSHGNAVAQSSGGGVQIKNVQGDVDAVSSGGGVRISGECGKVKAKSSGGPVKVNISNLTKEIYLESSGGSVDAVIPGGYKLGLDLDLSSDKVNIELHNFSGKSEKNRIKGTMNNGGIPVYMRSSGGNVNVRFEE